MLLCIDSDNKWQSSWYILVDDDWSDFEESGSYNNNLAHKMLQSFIDQTKVIFNDLSSRWNIADWVAASWALDI